MTQSASEEEKRANSATMLGKVKKLRQLFRGTIGVARVGKSAVGITELVKEWLTHCLDSGQSLSRRVL